VVISRGWGESKTDKTGEKAAWKQSGKLREREDSDSGVNKKEKNNPESTRVQSVLKTARTMLPVE